MSARRLTTEKQRQEIRKSAKFRGKKLSDLSSIEKDELLEILAKKARIL